MQRYCRPAYLVPGPLKWIYLTMGVLMGAAMVEHLRAVVRPAIGTSDSDSGRISGSGAGAWLDGQRNRQRIAGEPANDRAGDRGRTDGDGGRAGAGGSHPAR